jgi:hypothetical protein
MNASTLRALADLTTLLKEIESDRLRVETLNPGNPASVASTEKARDRILARWEDVYAAERRLKEALATQVSAQRDRWHDTLWGVSPYLKSRS